MIEIVIDYNNDKVIIDYGAASEERIPYTGQMHKIEYIIRKVLDKVMHSGESVTLSKMDEDNKYLIKDW